MRLQPSIAALCFFLAAAFGQSNQPTSLTHYQNGERHFAEHNYMDAANEFREALNGDLDPKWIEVWSHIQLGKIFEQTAQHERALNEFRLAVATRDNTRGAQDQAASYLSHEEPLDVRPLPAGVYRPGAGVFGPEPTRRIQPEYSEEARRAGLEGTVFVSGVIAEDGSPRDLRVTASLGLGLDEKALEAVQQWRFAPGTSAGRPVPVIASVAVDFLLPDKLSRWHLMKAGFQAPVGASRPVFQTAYYPPGAGISAVAIDEGWVLSAIRRMATATLSFDVDEHGSPVNFRVLKASLPIWGDEAISLVSGWRFTPGVKDGVPVSVPCTLDLIWGQKVFNAGTLLQVREAMNAQSTIVPAPSPDVFGALKVLSTALPSYPDEARRANLEGNVKLNLLIGEDGIPKDIHVVEPVGMGLDEKAVEAISQWRFQPALVNGRATPVSIVIEVFFRLSDNAPTAVILP
ncbi:MAG: energy transducer TonB [Acidobacteriia bacterium]|nr:energy transducer TonB [Terriglobia bacterium]